MKTFGSSVELAVSEACTNVVKHSVNSTELKYQVIYQIHADRIQIEVIDQGPGFNLEEVPAPDFDYHLQGGRGLYLIKDQMEQVSYTKETRGNVLKMVKFLPTKDSKP